MPLSSLAVVVMTKYPAPGKVKTRLTPDLTPEQAAAVHAVFLKHLTTRLTRLNPAELVICFDPPDKRDAMQTLFPPNSPFTYLPQSPGDLGQRLAAASAALFTRHARLLFLGVDSPDVPLGHLFTAAQLTEKSPVSLSPTADGGYWSLGLSQGVDVAQLLTDIPWSTGREALATLAAAERLGLTAATGLAWDDVDHPVDLRRLIQRLTPADAAADRALLVNLLRPSPEQRLS